MAKTRTKAVPGAGRRHEMKAVLEAHRHALVNEVHDRIRDARTDNAHSHDVLDEGDTSGVDLQDDIGFMLIQMKAETLHKVDTALRRIDEGTFGVCSACGEHIALRRLRALPFAVRCTDCEDAREVDERRERAMRVATHRHSL